jgi:hypothetical protein
MYCRRLLMVRFYVHFFFFGDVVLVLTFRCVLWFDRCRVLISAVVRLSFKSGAGDWV